VSGVDDAKARVAELKLGAKPEQVSAGCCGQGNAKADQEILVGGVEENLNHEQNVEQQSCCSPNVIALGAKNRDVSHDSIFAGASANQEGK
jgi:hypothetical protein